MASKLFLPSPRNPAAVNLSILEEIGCSKIVFSTEVEHVVSALRKLKPGLICEKLPSIEDILAQPAPPYVYDCRFDDVCRDPILILHSSGSTGRPKPVVMTNGTFATCDVRDFPIVPNRVNYDITTLDFQLPNSLIYEPFPPFHIAGFIFKILVPLYTHTSPIFGPSLRPPSGPLAAQVLQSLENIRALILPPTVIEDLCGDLQAVKSLAKLEFICFAGGPLAEAVGDEISKHTAVCQYYGSTEMGQVRQLFPRREDWAYMEVHPFAKHEMQKVEGTENLSELVFFIDESTKRTSSLNHNYPNLREWRTKDLFAPHPSKPNLWKFHARTDDILVFSSGEKLYPVDFERRLMALPGVSGALMVGNGRSRAGLIMELTSDHRFGEDPARAIWPAVQEINTDIPTQGRVNESMIITASPEKPFARAAKGTIIRRQTETLYALEIKEIFEGHNVSSEFVLKPTAFDEKTIMTFLRSALGRISMDGSIAEEDNLFLNGMDSVKTVELVRILKAVLSTYKPNLQLGWISLDFVYVNCTLKQLCTIILRFLNDGTVPRHKGSTSIIQDIVDHYIKAVPHAQSMTARQSVPSTSSSRGFSVALTGSTGYLGSNIVEKLLANSLITRIYCLDRDPDASKKWHYRHRQMDSKLRFLTVDLVHPELGLGKQDKQELIAGLDMVIHNAWPVNFNLPVTAFEPSFDGLINLVELCANGSRRPHMLFISSIASTGLWNPPGSNERTVPEGLINDPNAPQAMGYAQSKYVAENIMSAASSEANIPTTVLRVGFVCPSKKSIDTTGPSSDIIANVLQSSRTLKAIPSDFPSVDWITIDQVVSVVDELIRYDFQKTPTAEAQFYNLTNPSPLPWVDVLGEIQDWCGGGAAIVPMADWIKRVERAEGSVKVEELPALKVLKVFELFSEPGEKPKVDMAKLAAISSTVSNMEPVRPALVRLWLEG